MARPPVIPYPIDDDGIRWLAERHGNPEPTDGQCNNIRQQIEDKVKECVEKGWTNLGVATDGKRVYVHRTNIDSLAFAFR